MHFQVTKPIQSFIFNKQYLKKYPIQMWLCNMKIENHVTYFSHVFNYIFKTKTLSFLRKKDKN